MLRFSLDNSTFSLVLTDDVVAHFDKHRQRLFWQKEAGGQLFARFNAAETVVEAVTGPRPTDLRTRTTYKPDRQAEQIEIMQMFEAGLHYVGDWHTHPDPHPQPSKLDISSFAACYTSSVHELKAFVMIVVGTNTAPDGLRVSLHDASKEFVLKFTERNLKLDEVESN